MRITDEEYNRLIQENKELKEDHARLLDTIRLIGDDRDSLKAQRDQLRDRIAIEAMGSFITRWAGQDSYNEGRCFQRVAGHAYEMADAMIAARVISSD